MVYKMVDPSPENIPTYRCVQCAVAAECPGLVLITAGKWDSHFVIMSSAVVGNFETPIFFEYSQLWLFLHN